MRVPKALGMQCSTSGADSPVGLTFPIARNGGGARKSSFRCVGRVVDPGRVTSCVSPIRLDGRRKFLSQSGSDAVRGLEGGSGIDRLCGRRIILCSTGTGSASVEPESEGTPPKPAKSKFGSNVPWGKGKILEVMILWLMAFCLFRMFIWKIGMLVLGIVSEADLSASGQAAFTLGLDMSMLAGTLFILRQSLRHYRPLRKRGLFPLTFKGRWWIHVLVSCLCIPIVDWLGAKMNIWFPDVTDGLPTNMEVQLAKGDTVPNILYFILLSICAPIWEETMFRGFLLPSLGKYMPPGLAIFASSSIFAIMHGSLRQFLPLFILGIVIGNAFVASHNLLPSIVLHSLYNCYVFIHVLLGT